MSIQSTTPKDPVPLTVPIVLAAGMIALGIYFGIKAIAVSTVQAQQLQIEFRKTEINACLQSCQSESHTCMLSSETCNMGRVALCWQVCNGYSK